MERPISPDRIVPEENITVDFKDKLKKLRTENGLTQETLADAVHISRSAIAKYENGNGKPSEDTLKSLAFYFGVEIKELESDAATLNKKRRKFLNGHLSGRFSAFAPLIKAKGATMEKQYEIGNLITELRKEKKLTQSKLAEALGVTDKSVSKWENGKSLPDTKIMTRLCEILGISLEELLNGRLNPIAESPVLDDLQRFEHVYKYYSDDHRVNVGVPMFNSGNIEIGAPAFLFDRGRFAISHQ